MTSIIVLTDEWARRNPPGGGGGTATLPTGLPIIVRPNAQGDWDPITNRIPGAWYWWQRAITATTNAPIPTFTQGYTVGDMVSPPPDVTKGESLPYLGIVWSDSMATPSSGNLAGRTTNNYAGGTEPHQWGVTSGSGVAFPRTRQMSDLGLECADTGTAYIQSPPVNIAGDYRVGWNVNARTTSFAGGLVLTGTSRTSRITVLWVRGTTAEAHTSQVEVSIKHMEPENWATPTILGTVTAAQWAPITVTRRGLNVEVGFAGQTWNHTLTGEPASHLRQLAFTAGHWGTFSAKNVFFEAL